MDRRGRPDDLLKQANYDEYSKDAEAKLKNGSVSQTENTEPASECCRVKKERLNRNMRRTHRHLCIGSNPILASWRILSGAKNADNLRSVSFWTLWGIAAFRPEGNLRFMSEGY